MTPAPTDAPWSKRGIQWTSPDRKWYIQVREHISVSVGAALLSLDAEFGTIIDDTQDTQEQ